MKAQRVVRGYSFRLPNGNLDWQLVHSVEAAQSNAAFRSERPYSHISIPDDWHRAYKQGFRIVPVTMKAGASNGVWKKPAKDKG